MPVYRLRHRWASSELRQAHKQQLEGTTVKHGWKSRDKKTAARGGSAADGGGGNSWKLKPTSVARRASSTSSHALCPSIDLITPPSLYPPLLLPPRSLLFLPPSPQHPPPTIGHVSTRTQALPHAPVGLFDLPRGGRARVPGFCWHDHALLTSASMLCVGRGFVLTCRALFSMNVTARRAIQALTCDLIICVLTLYFLNKRS